MIRELTVMWANLCSDMLDEVPQDKRKDFGAKMYDLLVTSAHVANKVENPTNLGEIA